jgi:hypothetical protein
MCQVAVGAAAQDACGDKDLSACFPTRKHRVGLERKVSIATICGLAGSADATSHPRGSLNLMSLPVDGQSPCLCDLASGHKSGSMLVRRQTGIGSSCVWMSDVSRQVLDCGPSFLAPSPGLRRWSASNATPEGYGEAARR